MKPRFSVSPSRGDLRGRGSQDCCGTAANGGKSGYWRCARRGLGWIVPGSVLILMPKCPFCLAAYVALWTGIGLSASLAAGIRVTLLAVSALALCYLILKPMRRIFARRATSRV